MITIDPALDLFEEIERLKHVRRAIILAHYYQDPDIQDLADQLGDSLDLAKAARDASDVDVILFCGVHFMAETAKLLNPTKTVIVPDLDTGCSLADACQGDQLRAFRERNPEHFVVSYITAPPKPRHSPTSSARRATRSRSFAPYRGTDRSSSRRTRTSARG